MPFLFQGQFDFENTRVCMQNRQGHVILPKDIGTMWEAEQRHRHGGSVPGRISTLTENPHN